MIQQDIYNSAKTEYIACGDTGQAAVGSVIFQVRGNTWVGNLKVQGRARGASTLPFIDLPYQNLVSLADVAAGTTITADGAFAVRADGMEVQLVHTFTSGSVDIAVRALVG